MAEKQKTKKEKNIPEQAEVKADPAAEGQEPEKKQEEKDKSLQHSWTLEIKREKIDEKVESTLKEYAARVKLPGFRLGKVPLDVVKNRFSDAAEDEVVEKLLEEEILNHIRKENLNIVDSPVIEDIDRPKGGNVTARVVMELSPEVVLPDLSSLECTVEKKGPGYESFTEETEIEKVLEANKRRIPVEDREIREGDYVVIRYQSRNLENKRMTPKKEDYYEMKDDKDHEIPDLYRELIGKRKGDHHSVIREYPSDYHRSAWQGKKFEHLIEIMQHFEMRKPDLDDEFTKKHGYESVQQLKEKMKEEFEAYQQKLREDRKIEAIIKVLAKAVSFTVPQKMVAQELSRMVQNPSRHVHDLESFRDNHDALFNQLKEDAERNVRFSFIMEKLIKENALSVNQEDLDAEYQKIADANGADPKQVKRYYQEKQQREQLKDILLKRKVIDLLKEKVAVKEV